MGEIMTVDRRRFLSVLAASATLPALSRPARALDYPTRPVKMVIGFAPGGPADIIARLVGQYLSQKLGQPFVLDNRPGAGTTIATEAVAHATPDGYTLLWTTSADEINATLYKKLNYDFIRDIVPVASIDLLPLVMEVNPTFPAKTVGEFIAYAKANPGKINFASGGVGSSQHVAGELFDFLTGVKMVHVPYRGAALAVNDLLANQVQVTFSPIPLSLGYIRAGKLRALAVTSAKRSPALPDVPTVAETVPGYEAIATDGLGAPKGTPSEIVATLNSTVNAALADPALKARLQSFGAVPNPMSRAAFGQFIAAETEKWGKVLKFANIKPE
jgi:tripartite-type tricarboxylate transporter receptor subunit TctC